MTLIIEDDGPLLIVLFLLVCLISMAVQILEFKWQRRRLVVTAGPSQKTREKSHLFFYTVLILGLLTLVANYIIGITSSLAASHFEELTDATGLFGLPGFQFTIMILGIYGLAVAIIYNLFVKDERVSFPELLADLNDARKFGGLTGRGQIAHFTQELEALREDRDSQRRKQRTDGEFEQFFTAHEALDRQSYSQQLKYLNKVAKDPSRKRYFHRRLLFDYRVPAGKWLLPLALLTLFSFGFALREAVSMDSNDPDFIDTISIWTVAGILGLIAVIAQYRCEWGKALLRSRKEFVIHQIDAMCQEILAEAQADLASHATPPTPTPKEPGIPAERWRPILRIGRWQTARLLPDAARSTEKPSL